MRHELGFKRREKGKIEVGKITSEVMGEERRQLDTISYGVDYLIIHLQQKRYAELTASKASDLESAFLNSSRAYQDSTYFVNVVNKYLPKEERGSKY